MGNKLASIKLVLGILTILLVTGLNIDTLASTPDIGYAVLVAGEGGWREQWIINHNANKAYQSLSSLGFDDSRIFYLNNSLQDADGDGDVDVDAISSLANFESAIAWAQGRVGVDSPFILYLSGHGVDYPEVFFFDVGKSDGITSSLLDQQLGTLPGGTQMLIVINACYSGCFITVPDTVSATNRVIITSAHDDEKTYPYFDWFSHEFWSEVGQGVNIREAFVEATQRANYWLPGNPSRPWLDDNGDAVGHPPEALGDDGDFAATMTIGTSGGAPSVGEGAPNPALFNNCYTRNGGEPNLGNPINRVHWWENGYIQDFHGGEGYEGAIMQPDGVNDAFAIYGAIWAKYLSMGGAGGPLGYPLLDETEGAVSSITGARCRYNKFEGGAIVHRKETGPYESKTVFLGHGIFNKWEQLGYGASALGLPVCDENEAPQSGASSFYTTGAVCDFEAGHIYWHRTGVYANNAFEVHGAITGVYQNEGGPGSWLGFPVSDEYINTLAYAQSDFEGGYITTTDGMNYYAFAYTTLPTVETRPATSVLSFGALLNGRIVDDGGSAIIERRFDWGTTASCSDGWTADVSVSGDYFSYFLAGLKPDTTYYFRAWAKNATGWSHAGVLSFRTKSAAGGGAIIGWGIQRVNSADFVANDFIAIAAGWGHSLALKSDGSIVGWGYNYSGQATPPAGNDFLAISAGGYHSLALKSDGSIVGWGYNYYGQATPPAGNDFIAISAGLYHSLALKSDGSIVGWGYNYSGQATPPAGNDFLAISAGGYHSLALKSDGSIVGWGDNYYGQATPPAGNDFLAISAGEYHSLALKSDGTIVGWGYNYYGQATPPAGNNFIAISAGGYHSLALIIGQPCLYVLAGDLNNDCRVNFLDFAILANQWLQLPGTPSADIAPIVGDDIVNFLDLALMAEHWLEP